MKTLIIVLGVVLGIGAIAVIFVFWSISINNRIIAKDEAVKNKWATVQSQYQRRADLIPNLVSTVKGVANFEKGTLVEVTDARARATSIQVDPTKLDPQTIQKYQAAQGQLSTALGRLLVASENYPDLKANQNFTDLQVALEGTENRINVARIDFNDAVQDYNITIRQWPGSWVAGNHGYLPKGSFTADTAAQKAPKVSF